MIASMTGFGAAEGQVAGHRIAVEVRSVNHRFFTPSLKLPSALARLEPELREAMRQRVPRGHVTLSVRLERDGASEGPRIDGARLKAYVDQLRTVAAELGLPDALDLGALLRLPDVLVTDVDASTEVAAVGAEAVLPIVVAALDGLTRMRREEGARLVGYLEERLAAIDGHLRTIAGRAPTRLAEQRERLRSAIRDLADGVSVDETRLAHEVAILADRLDVNEELSRFASHNQAFREALAGGGTEPVGKRLGFLLQEMLREANTTGSKANDAGMQREVIAIKEELERMREQVENLE
jgi:uncharacterized protein (TIGR00255 family)